MPRYHFNVYDGRVELDETGHELPDLNAARRAALRHASEILDDAAHRDALGQDWQMEVTNANGIVLFSLDFHVTAASVLRGGPDARNGKST